MVKKSPENVFFHGEEFLTFSYKIKKCHGANRVMDFYTHNWILSYFPHYYITFNAVVECSVYIGHGVKSETLFVDAGECVAN